MSILSTLNEHQRCVLMYAVHLLMQHRNMYHIRESGEVYQACRTVDMYEVATLLIKMAAYFPAGLNRGHVVDVLAAMPELTQGELYFGCLLASHIYVQSGRLSDPDWYKSVSGRDFVSLFAPEGRDNKRLGGKPRRVGAVIDAAAVWYGKETLHAGIIAALEEYGREAEFARHYHPEGLLLYYIEQSKVE